MEQLGHAAYVFVVASKSKIFLVVCIYHGNEFNRSSLAGIFALWPPKVNDKSSFWSFSAVLAHS